MRKNVLKKYCCSESVEIASNDFYREYAKQFYQKEVVTFEEIKEIKNILKTKYLDIVKGINSNDELLTINETSRDLSYYEEDQF